MYFGGIIVLWYWFDVFEKIMVWRWWRTMHKRREEKASTAEIRIVDLELNTSMTRPITCRNKSDHSCWWVDQRFLGCIRRTRSSEWQHRLIIVVLSLLRCTHVLVHCDVCDDLDTFFVPFLVHFLLEFAQFIEDVLLKRGFRCSSRRINS